MQFSSFLADSLLKILTTEVDETTKTLFVLQLIVCCLVWGLKQIELILIALVLSVQKCLLFALFCKSQTILVISSLIFQLVV